MKFYDIVTSDRRLNHRGNIELLDDRWYEDHPCMDAADLIPAGSTHRVDAYGAQGSFMSQTTAYRD